LNLEVTAKQPEIGVSDSITIPLDQESPRSAATRRDAPVKCEACGRSVTRHSRQQRYCSDRCRQFALRENKARTAIKHPVLGQDTGRVTSPPKKLNGFNGLQSAKSQSTSRIYGPRYVLERELIAGCDWHEEISPDGVVTQVTQLRRGK
jgi:endogenous inhibitor of DNA gyrase (YacG/DUF329 family)